MEMKNRNVNHARNLFDRAVTLLPRVDQFWYITLWLLYSCYAVAVAVAVILITILQVYMEEVLGNIAGARQIFERWMRWEPEESAWNAYIKFEKRYKEYDRCRLIYERFVNTHPQPKNWLK